MSGKTTKGKERIGDRILVRRKELGLRQEDVSDQIGKITGKGLTRSTIAQWETHVTKPDGNNLIALAEVLNVSSTWLIRGGNSGIKTVGYVPEVTSMELRKGKTSQKTQRATAANVGPNAFAWRIPDSDTSMICPRGERSFPPKTVLIVDPAALPRLESGDFVLILPKGANDPICREYRQVGTKKTLVALNSKFQSLSLHASDILLGVVLEAQITLKQ
jgi:transcriptional regulator with XRE-family HTH domain